MDTVTKNAIAAQQALDNLLESESAYKFMSGCAEFMSVDGLRLLKQAAGNGQRWAFRLMIDCMKVLARMEEAKTKASGKKRAAPVRVGTTFASDGDKT